MQYVEAPKYEKAEYPSIFLAGGISGCRDWQKEIIEDLKDLKVTIYNPRRSNFPIEDKKAALEQITWEYEYLNNSNIIIFWFCKDTLNPIVLFELGAHLKDNKPIIIGIEPGYKREQDVIIQTHLVKPDTPIIEDIKNFKPIIFNKILNMLW